MSLNTKHEKNFLHSVQNFEQHGFNGQPKVRQNKEIEMRRKRLGKIYLNFLLPLLLEDGL